MSYSSMMRKYRVEMKVALQDFIRIDSTYDEKTIGSNMPFGKGVNDALQYIGKLGERFGFDVDYCNGYCTEISFGQGANLVSIFAHADVVPATGEWKYEKFGGEVVKNRMYGRGTSDDKGPMIAAFYALKALKDHNKIKDFRVKLIVGGDEERGSRCLDYYFKTLKKEYPCYGFTPDAEFPVIYGEKGITNIDMIIPMDIPEIVSLKGGIVYNAVCDKCDVVLKSNADFKSFAEQNSYISCDIVDNGDTMRITFKGKTAHGSTPEKGVNAGLMALRTLGEFYKNEKLVQIATLLSDPSGKSFECYEHGKFLGDTTFNLGVLSYDERGLKLGVNYRFPEDVDVERTLSRLMGVFQCEATHQEISAPLLLNPSSKLIKTLVKAYYYETGDKSGPFTIGGGTYAKHAKNTVAFGGAFPYSVDTMHQPDEYINLDDFYLMATIYCRAIHKLGKLE